MTDKCMSEICHLPQLHLSGVEFTPGLTNRRMNNVHPKCINERKVSHAKGKKVQVLKI